jgi:hypothetical protein
MQKQWPSGEDLDVLIRAHARVEREDHGGFLLACVLAALFVVFVAVILLWAFNDLQALPLTLRQPLPIPGRLAQGALTASRGIRTRPRWPPVRNRRSLPDSTSF